MTFQPVACPLCGADDAAIVFPARGQVPDGSGPSMLECTSTGLAQHGEVVGCRQCSMVYANPQPSDNALMAAYGEVHDPTYVEQRGGRERTFTWLLDRIERHVAPPGRMVDIGCYTGVFMELAAARGWTACGVELSEWAVGIARDADAGPVYHGTVDRAPISAGTMDLVTLLDVVEHLRDPVDMIERIATMLRPGGVLALTTHMIDSAAARAMGTRYPFLMDMHLVHFSRATISRLLGEAGFEVLGIEGHRRTVMADYFLDRVWNLVPALGSVCRPMARTGLARRTPVHVRGLGLVNVFARKS